MELGPSGHIDDFTRKNLPPASQWPEIDLGQFQYPEYINLCYELSDALVDKGFGNNIAVIGTGAGRTYLDLAQWTNSLAHALVDNFGLVPGNRVLIRGLNSISQVAVIIAVLKAGGVCVITMPGLRASELAKIVDKAEIGLALCDTRITEEVVICSKFSKYLNMVVGYDGSSGKYDGELGRVAQKKPKEFTTVKTGRDDVALISFTSGSTGEPKATMHFHRDALIAADSYAKQFLKIAPGDRITGSPPLAFTFGLGGLMIFPLRFGATAVYMESFSPDNLLRTIKEHKVTICFTAPTAYRMMIKSMKENPKTDISSLRIAVSAGETLPAVIFNEWESMTNVPILDGIGSTEMFHIFISNALDDRKAGVTGKVVQGYQAIIVNDRMEELPIGSVGRLAVRGPTGCRYLSDERQKEYVHKGWNLTGDSFVMDAEGTFSFVARNDDIIVSSGYNIAGPEVEASLLMHPAVSECAVIGVANDERGQIVQAHIVLNYGFEGTPELIKELQDHVKNTIAPFKYPRSVVFQKALPKTPSNKIQRYLLHSKAVNI